MVQWFIQIGEALFEYDLFIYLVLCVCICVCLLVIGLFSKVDNIKHMLKINFMMFLNLLWLDLSFVR